MRIGAWTCWRNGIKTRRFLQLAAMVSLSLFSALFQAGTTVAQSEVPAARRALIIGIDDYTDNKLKAATQATDTTPGRTANDAAAVADVLRDTAHYETVMPVPGNATKTVFTTILSEFIETIAPGDLVLVFFSGHGVEVGGQNYLLLADAPGSVPSNSVQIKGYVEQYTVSLSGLVALLQERTPGSIITIINACRTELGDTPNLSIATFPKAPSVQSTGIGTLGIYATAGGLPAEVCLGDCRTDASPYTVFPRRLIEYLAKPNLSAGALVQAVGAAVEADMLANDMVPQAVTITDQTLPSRRKALFLGPIQSVARLDDTEDAATDPAATGSRLPSDAYQRCASLAAEAGEVSFAPGTGSVRAIDAASARPACEQAMLERPGAADVTFWLGRVNDAERNYPAALSLYREAAAAGYGWAAYYAGDLYSSGLGTNRDQVQAAAFFEQAAAQDISPAITQLGLAYKNGTGVPPDNSKAIALFERAVALGNSAAPINLGLMYEEARGVPLDYAKARELYELGLQRGRPRANVRLAELYRDGLGVDKDPLRAAAHYLAAADAGLTEAMVALGKIYDDGIGVAADPAKAFAYFKRAADAKDRLGIDYLAQAYEQGTGVEVDYEQAAKLYFAAYQDGDGWAARRLGWLFEQGYVFPGTLPDDAIPLPSDPESSPLAEAPVAIDGEGAEGEVLLPMSFVDLERAEALYKAAIELGDDYAPIKLASLYGANPGMADCTTIVKLYQGVSGDNQAEALYNLAVFVNNWESWCSTDEARPNLDGMVLGRQAAELGFPDAERDLFNHFCIDALDDAECLHWAEVRQEDGDKQAKLVLAGLLFESQVVSRDLDRALRLLDELSTDQGDDFYNSVEPEQVSHLRARVQGTKNAAQETAADAAHWCYRSARGAPWFRTFDVDEALSRCTSAEILDPENRLVQALLGAAFDAAGDTVNARVRFERAAAAGSPFARGQLARYLREGTGGDRDEARAVQLLEVGAKANNAFSQNLLGEMLRDGIGIAADGPRSKTLFNSAADQNFVPAIVNLARMAEEARDLPEAKRLYRLAAIAGDPGAADRLDDLQ